ncbi:MAG: 1-deoxy-D-xylulose-5-phosphate reductoisomerase, partial [Terriglobales bacterium]
MPRSIAILGSTGSIGRNTLDVMASLGEGWRIAALAAGDNAALLAEQVLQFHPTSVSLRTPAAAEELRQRLRAAGNSG